jgi:hypothetical protein
VLTDSCHLTGVDLLHLRAVRLLHADRKKESGGCSQAMCPLMLMIACITQGEKSTLHGVHGNLTKLQKQQLHMYTIHGNLIQLQENNCTCMQPLGLLQNCLTSSYMAYTAVR